MKKLIILGTLLISAASFSAHHQNAEDLMDTGMMQMSCPMTHQKNSKMPMMTPEMKKEMQKKMIAIDEKKLELKKALAEDKIDWDKVGKLNRDIADMKADMKTEIMKKRYEMMQTQQEEAAKQEPAKKQ